ncbi:sensor histidine kinase [Ancylomarina salipaludis]|nr:sensor histidine kinase [Ancylomarina salipaludis]
MLGYQLYIKDMFEWNTRGYLKNYSYNIPSILYYSVIAVFARSYYDLQNSLEREYQLKNEKITTELNYLKSQIDPHFFFNNLNNIYSMAIKKDENITVMISRLSDMMRSYIYNSRLSKISLDKEIDFIENFVYFQLLKKPKSTDIDVYSDGYINDYFITPMLLINFVENAFKHSNIFHNTEASISINCFVDESKNLEFQVENTIYNLPNHSVSGIGNENTKRRLELLYPGRYKLIENINDNIYSIVLKIYNKTK